MELIVQPTAQHIGQPKLQSKMQRLVEFVMKPIVQLKVQSTVQFKVCKCHILAPWRTIRLWVLAVNVGEHLASICWENQ